MATGNAALATGEQWLLPLLHSSSGVGLKPCPWLGIELVPRLALTAFFAALFAAASSPPHPPPIHPRPSDASPRRAAGRRPHRHLPRRRIAFTGYPRRPPRPRARPQFTLSPLPPSRCVSLESRRASRQQQPPLPLPRRVTSPSARTISDDLGTTRHHGTATPTPNPSSDPRP